MIKTKNENKPEVPVWEKMTLSVAEAASVSGIGEKTIRAIVRRDAPDWAFLIGTHVRIKRKMFEDYINQSLNGMTNLQ